MIDEGETPGEILKNYFVQHRCSTLSAEQWNAWYMLACSRGQLPFKRVQSNLPQLTLQCLHSDLLSLLKIS